MHAHKSLRHTASTKETSHVGDHPAHHPDFAAHGAHLSFVGSCAGAGPRRLTVLAHYTIDFSWEDSVMNWDQIKGNWKQLKGKVREKWGKLTDDDLEVIAGKKDQLAGK